MRDLRSSRDEIEELDGRGLCAVPGLVDCHTHACFAGDRVDEFAGAGADSIVVLGMGGSGVSGDVAQAVVEPRLPVPMRTIKSYPPLPEWVGRNTVVFAVSYSGSTEETVAALEDGIERGARAVVIASGGPLTEIAARHGLACVTIPSGLQPRASLGYLTMPILAVLERIGLVPNLSDDVDEAVEVLSDLARRCDRKVTVADNPAKDLAGRIAEHVPVVYGGHGAGAVAAYRFKCDLNEYGKTPAFWHELPELDHNEIVGWNQLAELTESRFVVLMLRDPGEHERIALRFDVTRRLIKQRVARVIEITAQGDSELARLLSLIFVTQLAAIYVGLSYGVDPGPVEVVQSLKKELAKKEGGGGNQ
jgi:glucose/mannose-6-phosphate isomerase